MLKSRKNEAHVSQFLADDFIKLLNIYFCK